MKIGLLIKNLNNKQRRTKKVRQYQQNVSIISLTQTQDGVGQ